MTAVVVWVLSGVVVSVVSPRMLSAMLRRGVSAGVVLAVWAAMVCATIGIVAAPALAEVMSRCVVLVGSGGQARPDVVAAVISAAAMMIAITRGGWRLRSAGAARRDVHRRHLGVGRILGAHPEAEAVLWLPLNQPTAYSVAGQPPLVVASTGLRASLDADALASVLAHERAHIDRHHHTLVGAAEALAAGLPWLPLLRRSPALVRALVEIDADDHAARTHGPRSLYRALQTLRTVDAPTPTLAITGDDVALRMARLATFPSPADPIASANVAFTSLTAVLLAVLSTVALVVVTAFASCTAF